MIWSDLSFSKETERLPIGFEKNNLRVSNASKPTCFAALAICVDD